MEVTLYNRIILSSAGDGAINTGELQLPKPQVFVCDHYKCIIHFLRYVKRIFLITCIPLEKGKKYMRLLSSVKNPEQIRSFHELVSPNKVCQALVFQK